jgi:hypothetical protein
VKKKIYLYLCGGLGNQLFQYAAARNLAILNNAELIIDISTGFITDFRDRRKFSLDILKLKNVRLKKIILVYIFYIIFKKIFKIKNLFNNFFFFNLINEMEIDYFERKIKNFKFNRNLYLFGFFQSEKYFTENKLKIIQELIPSDPVDKIFVDMKRIIVDCNSVSIGVRMYEDLPESIHSKLGGLTTLDFYKNAIKKIVDKVNNPVFFLFSTKNSNLSNLFSEILELKQYKSFIITDDNNFKGAAENLWLMSHCKHHIISNSSLYWWAAYMSTSRYKNQHIICSNNFINQDTRF